MTRARSVTVTGAARGFHLVMILQLIGWVIALAVLFSVIEFETLEGAGVRWGVRAAALVLFAVLAAATAMVGRGIAPAADGDAWWRANGARVRLLWVIADGVALAGALLYFLTGVLLALFPFLAGVATLVLQRPSKVVEG